jgi:hypothetical protein
MSCRLGVKWNRLVNSHRVRRMQREKDDCSLFSLLFDIPHRFHFSPVELYKCKCPFYFSSSSSSQANNGCK